ncbi:MAG: hypothetical protein WAK12_05595 [Acidimicrobiales bacterium]
MSAFLLLAVSLTLVETTASAAGDLPPTINYVVSPNGTLTDAGFCPASLATFSPAPTAAYNNLASAVAAASSGNTIYVCAGAYDLSDTTNYGTDENVVINEPLTIDGYNWDVAPSSSDTTASVDPSTQSEFENGSGFLVQAGNVVISGLTFYDNSFDNPNTTLQSYCQTLACADSIDVQSLVSGVGDQGESGVTISNNLFVDTGGGGQNGVVHFGLGQDGLDTNVNALDTGDVISDNVFTYDVGYENNMVQMSDTTGAAVTGNTVTYPTNNGSGQDDSALTALWFDGFNQGLTVSNNTLNGGGIFNDSSSLPTTQDDPKSGIKIIDMDEDGTYGSGCSDQSVTDNTVSGFVYDVSIIGNDVNDDPSLCVAGPTDFTVSGNTLNDARIYGIYVSADATDGTISNNVASDTDSETYSVASYSVGEYDYYDAFGAGTSNTWTNDSGNGYSYPDIGEVSTTTTTTTTTTGGGGGGGGGGGSPTTTISTSPPPPPPPPPPPSKPLVTVSTVTLGAGNKVDLTMQCADTNCSGIIELTKLVGPNELLGKVSYTLAKGSQRLFKIPLNAKGVKIWRTSKGHHFTCELTWTSKGGTKHKNITL